MPLLLRLRLVPTQIMQILGSAGLRRLFTSHGDGAAGVTLRIAQDDLEDDSGFFGSRRRARTTRSKNKFPNVPSEEGQKLMNEGIFGASEYYRDTLRRRTTTLAKKLMRREMGDDRKCSTRAPNAISQVRDNSDQFVP